MKTLTPLFFHTIRTSHIQRLTRCFPRVCSGLVEDAVDEAWLELHRRGVLGRPLAAETDDRPALLVPEEFDHSLVRWWLFRVAWCQLRNAVRRRAFRRETGEIDLSVLTAAREAEQEEELVMEQQLRELVPEAARRFGGRYRVELEGALYDRFVLGLSDREAALAHDVPREYVNRAKNWILDQLLPAARVSELRAA